MSLFIEQAVNFYLTKINKQNLAQQLKEGAIKRSQRDLNISIVYAIALLARAIAYSSNFTEVPYNNYNLIDFLTQARMTP